MKNTLILNYEYPPLGGGAGVTTKNLATLFAKEGIRVTVITSGFKNLAKTEIVNNVEIRRYNSLRSKPDTSTPLQMLFSIIAMVRPAVAFCKKEKPDLIHCNFAVPTGIVAYICNKITKIPYIITVHGGDVPSFNKLFVSKYFYAFSHLIKPLTYPVWRNAAKVICASDYFYDLIKKDYPKIEPIIIPLGVDTKFFYSKPKIRSNKLTLIFFSRLTKQKGVITLIEALHNIDAEFDWELKIIGDGPEKSLVENKIKEYNFTNKVKLLGWQSQEYIRQALWESDILLFPSVQESFGLVIVESMATGTPVIASNIPVLKEIIDKTKCGLVINDWNKDLAKALVNVLDTKYDFNAIGMYTWENTSKEHLKLFRNLYPTKFP